MIERRLKRTVRILLRLYFSSITKLKSDHYARASVKNIYERRKVNSRPSTTSNHER